MLELGLKVTLAYWLGGVLGSLVAGYVFGRTDIRNVGSGNAGATNALRTHGKLFALCVVIIDVGKGILAVAVIPGLALPGINPDPGVDREILAYAVAFAAIAGHVFPVWFDFRGGKGGATAAGLLCYFSPALAAPVLALWVVVVVATGFVGLATMTASVGAAAYLGIAGGPEQRALAAFAAAVALLIVYTHRGNIQRMWHGHESRFGRRFERKQ
jgi:acyl phosphate:glycerol-3-phosphate acyltransferase